MIAPYKKRSQKNWNRDKGMSNKAERAYKTAEIEEQQSEFSKSGAGRKRRKSENKELENALRDVRRAIKFSKGGIEKLNVHGDSWMNKYYQELYQKYKKAIPFLKESLKSESLDNKIRKQITELLGDR